MPDFQKIIDGIKAILELIFGKDIPGWIFTLLGYILVASLLLVGIWALLAVVAKIVTL